MNRLNQRLSAMKDDKPRCQAEVMLARHGLYDVCFQEIINYTSATNPQLADILRKLRLVHTSLFQSFPLVLQDIQGAASQAMTVLRENARQAQAETAQLLEAAEQLEREAMVQQEELQRMKVEVAKLTSDNEALKKEGSVRVGKMATPLQSRLSSRVSKYSPPTVPDTTTTPTTTKTAPSRESLSPDKAYSSGTSTSASSSNCGEDGVVRNLRLKQLKDLVELIYQSKERHDAKCRESRLPRETMEQHMYTFLNTR